MKEKTPALPERPQQAAYELVLLYIYEFRGLIDKVLPLSKACDVSYDGKRIDISSHPASSYPEHFHSILSLVGRNGVGKTSYIEAIKKLLDDKNASSPGSFVVFRQIGTSELFFVGDYNPNIAIYLDGTEADVSPIDKNNLDYYLITVDDGNSRGGFQGSSATRELYDYYREEIETGDKKHQNIFDRFKLPKSGKVVVDISPDTFENAKTNVNLWGVKDSVLESLKDLYSQLEDDLNLSYYDDDYDRFLKTLYLKYLTVNSVRRLDRGSLKDTIEEFETILNGDDLNQVPHLTSSKELNLYNYDQFKDILGEHFFSFNEDSNDFYSYLERVNSSFVGFVFRIDFDQMSSGQNALIIKLSTIYSGLMKAKEYKRNGVIVLIDEIDMYIHPEWERLILLLIQDLMRKHPLRCELIFSTHSPITLSDLQKDSVVYLESLSSAPVKKRDFNPFMQNIHLLLKNPFFLEDTLGEMGKNYVRGVIDRLEKMEKDLKLLTDESLKTLDDQISEIGEVIIRERLQAKLSLLVHKKLMKKSSTLAAEFMKRLSDD